MEGSAKIHGLKDAMAAMRAAFPANPEQQRRMLNQAMSGAARKSIIPIAKQLALQGDSSGALSEAIAPRAISRRRALARGMAAGVEITPVRHNRKAVSKYIQYYYNRQGIAAPMEVAISGIRHGHLVEFGYKTRGSGKKGGFLGSLFGGGGGSSGTHVGAQPVMGPALQAGRAEYVRKFSTTLKRKVELAVRRRARKTVKK